MQDTQTNISPPNAPGRGRLQVQVVYGLGNRIWGFLSAVKIGEVLGVPVEVFWPEEERDWFGSFHSLFKAPNFPHVRFVGASEGSWRETESISASEVRGSLLSGNTVRIRARSMFCEQLLPGWQFVEGVRELRKQLQPVDEVMTMVHSVPEPELCIHIRGTDHLPCRIFTPRWCYRLAVREMVRTRPASRILICADSPRFARELQKTYPDNISVSPSLAAPVMPARNTLEGSRAALADLWLLSRCRTLFCSPSSSFGVAANLPVERICPLANVENMERHRKSLYAWSIHRQVTYNAKTDTFRSAGKPGWKQMIRGKLSELFAGVVCSEWYQEHPWPGQRRAFLARLRKFLDASERLPRS